MKVIDVAPVEPSEYDKHQFAIEVAYAALVARAIRDGLLPMPVNPPLDEFPDEAVAQQFKDACKAMIEKLKAQETPVVSQ